MAPFAVNLVRITQEEFDAVHGGSGQNLSNSVPFRLMTVYKWQYMNKVCLIPPHDLQVFIAIG